MGKKEINDDEEESREINKTFAKKSKKIGRPVYFLDTPYRVIEKIPSSPPEQAPCIPQDPFSRYCQTGPDLAENSSNTLQVEWNVKGVAHREGGWPREIDCQEVDQVNRYLKKIEKDEGFLNSAMSLANLMEEKVKQNNAVEIYTSYFSEEDEVTSWCESEARTVMVYCDPIRGRGEAGRPVSGVSWSPEGGSKLAVAYCSPHFLASQGEEGDGFTFAVEDPTQHCDLLASTSPLTSIAYSCRDPNTIAGGCYSGSVSCWDVRADTRPVSSTSFTESHTEPVYSVIWTASKTATEMMTGGSEGLVKWWDTRNLSRPRDQMMVDTENKDPASPGCLDRSLAVREGSEKNCLEYEPTIPAKFMVGTEQGLALGCTRKAKCQSEYILSSYQAHYGPVRALQRNPSYTKNFLTVGDWSARVWSEDITESCLFWVNSGTEMLTDGCWSPTRPSLFFTSRTDGWLEAWDMIENQRRPVMTHKVHEGAAHCLAQHPEGDLICVGGDSGDLAMIQLSPSLVEVTKAEKFTVATMLERETRREKILSTLKKEDRLKSKAKSKMKMIMDSGMLKKAGEDTSDNATVKAEQRFFQLLKQQKDERLKLGRPLIFNDEE